MIPRSLILYWLFFAFLCLLPITVILFKKK